MSTATTNGRIDTGELRAAAEGRWYGEILPACGFDREDLDGTHGPCPKCGGQDRFRAIDASAGAVFCSQCFSEENGDGFAAIQWMQNCNFPEAKKMVADAVGFRATSHANNGHHDAGGHDEPQQASDIVAQIARRKRVSVESWKAFGAHVAQRGKMTVCRLPMYDAKGDACSYCDFAELDDKWLKGMNAKNDPPGSKPAGLYYAQRPKPGDTVLVCEGPKDAAALHSIGFHAVGLPSCKLAKHLAFVFLGCHLVLVPDNDVTGHDSAHETTAPRLKHIAASVKIARLPGEIVAKDGDGVREILGQTNGESLIRQAIANAVLWEPAPQDDDGPPPVDGHEWTSLRTDQGRNDCANSRRFLAANRDRVRYCFPWSKWLLWDVPRWKVDDDGAILRLGKAVADDVWMQAKNHLTKEVADFAVSTSGHSKINAMTKLAAAEVPVSVDEMDANPWLLNCPNGVVDLRTGQLRAHRREDYLTKLCPINFNPDAPSYHFDRFLEGIFSDGEIIPFVQRLAGYCLTGDVSEQILPVFYGSGANGKSTFLNAIQSTLGDDYTAAAPPSLLMEKKTETHPTELAGLFGRRLVIAQETAQGARLAESVVKQLTGGDRISARRMREDFWTFSPTHKLVICSNHKPRVKGTDHAIWRRLVLIPFERRFWNPAKGETGPDDLRQDKDLPAKLAAEAEGILAWMVQGCLDWQRGGLRIPDSVRAATADYRSEQDTLGRFVTERCLIGQAYKVRFSDFYNTFEEWCADSGDNVPSRKFVGEWLRENGYQDRHSTVRWYLGIALQNTNEH